MKHGPIALVDENLPVVVLAPHDGWREKTLSNLREVKSRDGIAIVVTTRPDPEVESLADHVLVIPETSPELQPILSGRPAPALRVPHRPCGEAATSTSRGISRRA